MLRQDLEMDKTRTREWARYKVSSVRKRDGEFVLKYVIKREG